MPQPHQQHIRTKKRKYYNIDRNLTISRAADFHIHNNWIEDLNLSSDLIRDHAYRRVQLFYYLLRLYRGEGAHIELAGTRHQHGKSKCPNCAAAHSSILPNVVDDKRLLKQDSALYNNMNSTVEVPKIVNEYECLMESRLRTYAVALLNHASNNPVHPYIALKAFVQKMQTYFEVSKSEIGRKMKLIHKVIKIEALINDLELFKPKDPVFWMSEYVRSVNKLYELRKRIVDISTCSGRTKLDNYPAERDALFSIINARFSNKEKANGAFSQTLENLNAASPLAPDRYRRQLNKLAQNLKIIELEKEATVLPPFKQLTGKVKA